MNEYQELLREWLDAMLNLQLKGTGNSRLDGGILCPACREVHGRCGDAIYPLIYFYSLTREERYLAAADALFDWTEANVQLDSGGYRNGSKSSWSGITVFAAIGLGKTLLEYGSLLGDARREKWMRVFLRLDAFLEAYFKVSMPNVNYPISYTAELALAYRLTGEEHYLREARRWYGFVREHFTPDGLIYGEGHPMELLTEKGCRGVDLGYNVEESLPNLVLYARLTEDEEALDEIVGILRTHLEFMLPDGAWDNSFGSRMAKWTYWGSRTSDGCQAIAMLADRDPVFGEAAHRSFELYRRCTTGGLLAGGPMYASAGEPPCVHHTFCHAKALAELAESGYCHGATVPLPREVADGARFFPSVHVSLAARGPWRATVSDYDFRQYPELYPTGGALTMLWHDKCGPLAAATMTAYKMVESGNMQLPIRETMCGTPRIECELDGVLFRSVNDTTAAVTTADEGGLISVTAHGVLRNAALEPLPGGEYTLCYAFSEENVKITACCGVAASFLLPLVSPPEETVKAEESACVLCGEFRKSVTADGQLSYPNGWERRGFNPVGGFTLLPLSLSLPAGQIRALTLRVD